ncbi:hypothetical protein BQ8482_180389 [Mesorhizobium delmotii]|uniref:Uncharacterized protein n=1 Tax=Mesorhizobium delmotii TaxID=1631247 RepID=A0A2P9AJ61_9HYPH|nr:hypothetical protein BQ8482_180389 [Mesorhizobium delmotii]
MRWFPIRNRPKASGIKPGDGPQVGIPWFADDALPKLLSARKQTATGVIEATPASASRHDCTIVKGLGRVEAAVHFAPRNEQGAPYPDVTSRRILTGILVTEADLPR